MLKCFKNFDAKKTGLFAAGVLFGTAGIKILSSKDAKKLYTNCTAAVLRAKEVVLKTATKVQENAVMNICIGIMNKYAWLHITLGIDM